MEISVFTHHPYCLAFPEKNAEDYANHLASIKEYGQLEPVKLFEGKILDGRHNERACLEAGITVWYEEFVGTDEQAAAYVKTKNCNNRTWTKGQRAATIISLQDLLNVRSKGAESTVQGERLLSRHSTIAERAAEAGLSRAYYLDLQDIAKASPELLEEVKQGKKSIKQAHDEVHVPVSRKNKPKPTQLETAQKRTKEALEMVERLKDAVQEYQDEIAELKEELAEVKLARDAYLLAMEGNMQQAIDAALEREKAALQMAKQANIQNDISLRQKGVAIETLKRAQNKATWHS